MPKHYGGVAYVIRKYSYGDAPVCRPHRALEDYRSGWRIIGRGRHRCGPRSRLLRGLRREGLLPRGALLLLRLIRARAWLRSVLGDGGKRASLACELIIKVVERFS